VRSTVKSSVEAESTLFVSDQQTTSIFGIRKFAEEHEVKGDPKREDVDFWSYLRIDLVEQFGRGIARSAAVGKRASALAEGSEPKIDNLNPLVGRIVDYILRFDVSVGDIEHVEDRQSFA
jgi:hypothetical protein